MCSSSISRVRQMSFVFYDLETTGVSTAFDQPLQFAAIYTNTDLKEIERVELRCRIAPHIIPSPYALMVTGIKPEQLVGPDLPSFFEFTQSVMELTKRWAPATWMGFNSIRFDEELLRQALAHPSDAASIAKLADSEQAAREIYAASARIANGLNAAERDYLDALAMGLKLDPELAARLETDVRTG